MMNRHGLTLAVVLAALYSPLPLVASCGQERESGMTRDDLYRNVLKKLETVEELAAKDAASPALAQAVDGLRSAVRDLQSGKREAEGGTKTGTAPPPQGPFPPSQRPSPESEQERRRKATEERFPSGPPLEKETASIQGVPDDWIASSCDDAQAELARIDELRKKTPVDRKQLQAALEKLASVLRGMQNPPPPK